MSRSYSPPWAPNVVGTFPEREYDDRPDGTKVLVPMKIEMVCNTCQATHQYTCPSGAVHQWIQRFALNHTHKDPFTGKPR